MKWPNYLCLVRHARSEFNELKARLEQDPLWPKFVEEYKIDFRSRTSKILAKKLLAKYENPYGDRKTPLTKYGRLEQSVKNRIIFADTNRIAGRHFGLSLFKMFGNIGGVERRMA